MWFKNEEKEVYIGEVYYGSHDYGYFDVFPAHSYPNADYQMWRKFTNKEINKSLDHDGYLCISGKLHKRENVIFYDDVYVPLRQAAEERLRKSREVKDG